MAKKSKTTKSKTVETIGTISTSEIISTETLDSLMGDRFASYAKDVITDRAIPDVRDGLKPVQRRIIYDMWESNYVYNKPRVKCLKITGEVMGKYHPHGDSSIYEALVRLSQSWKMSVPLIDFKGNNDSLDSDGPAAARYTEARLNEFANNLLKNLEKKNVPMTLNYDDKLEEPVVLPAYFPSLYVNGSEGIAVGLATKIPTHNLNEMNNAAIYRIKHPRCELSELLEIVKGPDFPTGGKMYKTDEIEKIYRTGEGRVDILCTTHIEEGKDYNKLVITEIPYGVIKKTIPYRIDVIKKNNEVDGIIEVRDLSEGDNVNIEVLLKKDIDPKIIEQYLVNKKVLKDSYSANIVAIVNNHPRTLTLTSYLDSFISFQIEIRIKGFKYDLEKAEAREHIVSGLIKALSVIDEVVRIIRKSKNKADAKLNLMNAYDFSEKQAEAIVTMPLYKLTTTDVQTYIDEQEALNKQINYLKDVLGDENKIRKIIISDLEELNKKYPTPRRTQIIEAPSEQISIQKKDLISQEDVYVVITRDGYVKTSTQKSVKFSNNSLPGVKGGDTIVMNELVSNLDTILAFTNKGNFLYIPVYEIQEGKWKDEGKHINYMCNLPLDESIVKCIIVSDFNKNVYIGMVSKRGLVKKTHLSEFIAQRYSKPIKCFKLSNDDELADVSVLNGKSNILITTELGYYSLFNENQVSDTHLASSGIKAIKSSALKQANVISLLSFRKDERNKLAILTDKGTFRVYDSSKLEESDRLSRTEKIMSCFKKDIQKIVYLNKLDKASKTFDFAAVLNDNSVFEGSIDDLRFVPAETNCKSNIDLGKNKTIKYVYINTVQCINENTIEEGGRRIVRDDSYNDDDGSDDDGSSTYENLFNFEDTNNDLEENDSVEEEVIVAKKPAEKEKAAKKKEKKKTVPEKPQLSPASSSFLEKLRNPVTTTEPKKKKKAKIVQIKTDEDDSDDNNKDDHGYEQVSIFDDLGD